MGRRKQRRELKRLKTSSTSPKKEKEYDIHHRILKSQTVSKVGGFPILVDKKRHNYWHCLFSNMDLTDIVDEMNRFWINPNYEIYIKRREL